MDLKHIRNFSIIAHVDHGKSTLADRMLEITGTIEKRKMMDQVLDRMELERERGITIKMKPVRMKYRPAADGQRPAKEGDLDAEYTLNLIDTPGHIDFYYEVSRALKAVEGAILLVDATQGVQAQTLTTLGMAREAGLTILPVVSKVDMPTARPEEVKQEISSILGCRPDEVLEVSGKTGQGVPALLAEIIKKVPPPVEEFPESGSFRSLVFDFRYSNHTGVIVYVRVFDGAISKTDQLMFGVAKEKFTPIETGIFTPDETPRDRLEAGESGYIVTGIKRPGVASVGDTLTLAKKPLPVLPGYMLPKPVVWVSLYPENQSLKAGIAGGDDWNLLRQALGRLKLSDSSFTFEEESSGILGRGFRCGFLGMLHLEIITERLKREHHLSLIITTPSIRYEVIDKKGHRMIAYSPTAFPDYGMIGEVFEPWVDLKIIAPAEYLGPIIQLLYAHEAEIGISGNFGDNRNSLEAKMPLRELMRNFFDNLKSVSSGFGSLSYSIGGYRKADVIRLDVLVANEIVSAFTKIISRRRLEEEAKATVEKLHELLPARQFTVKIQAMALGRIIASKTLSAMRKDVTGYLYGGDITRKRKLWEQQKEGKKRLKEKGRVEIPQEVFVKMMRND
jgi:GTP-binding protein LepA